MDTQQAERVKVWDIAVRVFHWSLVVFFTVSYLTGEELERIHELAGYTVLGLIIFRVIWGVIGGKYARFSDFLYGPKATMAYARSLFSGKPIHYLGHNPLGGWMIAALLVSLLATSWTGLELLAGEGKGPLAAGPQVLSQVMADDDERSRGRSEHNGDHEFWEEVHEFFANLTLLLVFVHIAGVVSGSIMHRENLVRAMVTGYKKAAP